jgi:hypothetical protein
MNPT